MQNRVLDMPIGLRWREDSPGEPVAFVCNCCNTRFDFVWESCWVARDRRNQIIFNFCHLCYEYSRSQTCEHCRTTKRLTYEKRWNHVSFHCLVNVDKYGNVDRESLHKGLDDYLDGKY